MSITHNKDIKSPVLDASIVEPILHACMNAPSTFELSWVTQSMLAIPFTVIKQYLFYLIDYEVILYNGQKRAFIITDGGFDLLNMIDAEIKHEKKDIKDITIIFECTQQ